MLLVLWTWLDVRLKKIKLSAYWFRKFLFLDKNIYLCIVFCSWAIGRHIESDFANSDTCELGHFAVSIIRSWWRTLLVLYSLIYDTTQVGLVLRFLLYTESKPYTQGSGGIQAPLFYVEKLNYKPCHLSLWHSKYD